MKAPARGRGARESDGGLQTTHRWTVIKLSTKFLQSPFPLWFYFEEEATENLQLQQSSPRRPVGDILLLLLPFAVHYLNCGLSTFFEVQVRKRQRAYNMEKGCQHKPWAHFQWHKYVWKSLLEQSWTWISNDVSKLDESQYFHISTSGVHRFN